ncbi:hypothetical protein HPB49_010510 [Dermacentor silvarum]|uniref:Uncharacterized protein n=1 Tax=Dermacentor silvarum TaxID=543639 RepID=A0ACB8D4P5_DERSI|nr:hypothetical protein HPB49_010510 [Dermacentor silvarum]
MEEEGITLYGVAETHLRDLKRPPVNPLWNWAGCNRESTSRKGGGVGFLWREGSTWTPLEDSCVEHTWLWTKRLQQLSKKYGFFASPVQEETERKWAKAVETLVRQTEVDTWRRDMEGKSTLKLYREHKQEIRVEPLYDNSVASSLLFEARAGALRTLVYRRRYDDNRSASPPAFQLAVTKSTRWPQPRVGCGSGGP